LDRLVGAVKVLQTDPVEARGVNLAVIADGRLSDAHGWGVPVRCDGRHSWVLTALHVLKDGATLEIRPARVCVGGEWLAATLVKTDAEHDLALLKVEKVLKAVDVQPSEAMQGAVERLAWMRVPGCLPGWSGTAVLDVRGRIAALIIRSQSINSVPIEGEAAVVPAGVLGRFLGLAWPAESGNR
jgi:S1-C subfamily serine protease